MHHFCPFPCVFPCPCSDPYGGGWAVLSITQDYFSFSCSPGYRLRQILCCKFHSIICCTTQKIALKAIKIARKPVKQLAPFSVAFSFAVSDGPVHHTFRQALPLTAFCPFYCFIYCSTCIFNPPLSFRCWNFLQLYGPFRNPFHCSFREALYLGFLMDFCGVFYSNFRCSLIISFFTHFTAVFVLHSCVLSVASSLASLVACFAALFVVGFSYSLYGALPRKLRLPFVAPVSSVFLLVL